MEFYSCIVDSGDQLRYYASGIGTSAMPSSSMGHMCYDSDTVHLLLLT